MKNVNTHCDTGICNDPACGDTCVMGGSHSVGGYSFAQASWDWLVGGILGFLFGFAMFTFFIH